MEHQAFQEILVCVLNMKRRYECLMISFLILGLPGAPGQKGEPGKYEIK
jgi:hypothetical protein